MANSKSGNPGEAAVLNAFVQRGYQVLVPFGEGQPYDLVVDLGEAFLRVQCKTAWASEGCILFNPYATDHGRGQMSYVGRADVFGVYFRPTGAVYLVPVGLMRTDGRLRLDLPRNNQRRRVRFAAQFEFDVWTSESLRELTAVNRARSGEAPAKLVA